jgi:hypothetical protein
VENKNFTAQGAMLPIRPLESYQSNLEKELVMKRTLTTCFIITLACLGSSRVSAQEMPEMPKPQKEHEWLQKFVGEWDSLGKGVMAEGEPPMECKGSTKSRMLGGFWLISEGQGDAMGVPMETVMQLGFDTKKNKFVGTWADSMFNHMWHYEGTVEGDTLTLNTEGPNMTDPGKMAKYRDVFEFKTPDHYTLSSSAQGENGKWTTFMTADFRKKN